MQRKLKIAYRVKTHPKLAVTLVLNRISGLAKLAQAGPPARLSRSAEACGFDFSNWGVAAHLRVRAPMKTSQALT